MQRHADDYELVKNSINGDNSSFEELISRYKNLVYSVVLRMVSNGEEANDLAQEVFIKMYRNLDKYQPEFKFSTWLMRIATNHVIDYRRKKKHDTISIDDMPADLPDENTPEAAYFRKDRRLRLEDALNGLPDMYKAPIVLYHQHGFSYNEIADITGQPLSKVKNRIFRGRKMLLEALKEGGRNEM